MTDQYSAIATLYDSLAADASIQALYRQFRRALLDAAVQHGITIRLLVDLACGTGNSTIPWTRQRGWRVIGIDRSSAMLRRARQKSSAVQWLRQDITHLRLSERADAVTCHFDALNHVLDARSLQRVFVNVAGILRPGGVFVFDVSTPAWLQWLNGREKLFHPGRHWMLAHNELDAKSGVATFRQTWFVPKGQLFEKRDVRVRERGYADSDVRRMLRTAGFRSVSVKTQVEIDRKRMRLLYTAIADRPR